MLRNQQSLQRSAKLKKKQNNICQSMQPCDQKFSSHTLDQHPKFVSIDQTWIATHHIALKQSLITCPICYTIPLDYPYECSKCQRIFCKKDYQRVIGSQNQSENRCPTCKLSPWVKKDNIHIAYKHMFDSLRLKCKICSQHDQRQLLSLTLHDKQMTKQQLIEHLQQKHDMFLSEQSIIYDFVFVPENQNEIKLNWIQNLQINIRKSMNLQRFQIGANHGKVLTIDLKQMTVQHPTQGKCKIIQHKSKTLKRNKQYMIWTVDISDKQPHQIYLFQNEINQSPSYFNTSDKQRVSIYNRKELSIISQKLKVKLVLFGCERYKIQDKFLRYDSDEYFYKEQKTDFESAVYVEMMNKDILILLQPN